MSSHLFIFNRVLRNQSFRKSIQFQNNKISMQQHQSNLKSKLFSTNDNQNLLLFKRLFSTTSSTTTTASTTATTSSENSKQKKKQKEKETHEKIIYDPKEIKEAFKDVSEEEIVSSGRPDADLKSKILKYEPPVPLDEFGMLKWSWTNAELKRGKLLFQKRLSLESVASKAEQLPKEPVTMNEIAFIGRSNVGKSSLINALASSNLARTSQTPGSTQTINFYSLIPEWVRLVDLPGYGFSRAPSSVSDEWKDLSRAYVEQRRSLRLVLVLIDSVVGFKDSDLEFISFLEKCNRPEWSYQVILTKADKVKENKRAEMVRKISDVVDAKRFCYPYVLPTSAVDKSIGLDHLKASIVGFLSDHLQNALK